MMCSHRLFFGAALALVITMGVATAHATVRRDETRAVRSHVTQQAEAWNRHDAAAYSALFTPDCDVVNIVGWWWTSRDEMQRKLTRAFSSIFRDSHLRFGKVDVRFLTPTIAVAHARWTMHGAHMPPGIPAPDAGIQTLVLTRHDGAWSIAAFQNTLSRPEHPFPAADTRSGGIADPR